VPILSFDLPSVDQVPARQTLLHAGPWFYVYISTVRAGPIREPPFRPDERYPVMIDTGASINMIRPSLVAQLRAPVVDRVRTFGIHGPGVSFDPIYLLRYFVTELDECRAAPFVAVDFPPGPAVVFGRTFLDNKIMIYDGVAGRLTLTV
jgi:hypothetical protein